MFEATWARTCLQGTCERKIVKSLNVFPHEFFSFLYCQEKFIHGHLDVILVELRKELGSQVNPRINGAVWKTSEPIKGYSFKSADE